MICILIYESEDSIQDHFFVAEEATAHSLRAVSSPPSPQFVSKDC